VRVQLRADLEQMMAARMVPVADRLARQVAAEARVRAPAARIWVTVADERVRPSHRDADQQLIPANLRFKLRKQVSRPGREPVLATGVDLAREPRDPALPAGQRDGCRCVAIVVPKAVALKVRSHAAVLAGRRATARVSVEFPRIVEAHTGTSGDTAAPFLRNALDAVAARLRARARP
jgi:hypothetical protein